MVGDSHRSAGIKCGHRRIVDILLVANSNSYALNVVALHGPRFKSFELHSGYPLVLINACRALKSGSIFYDGFAEPFLYKNARCLIGPVIEMPVVFGKEFARRFFQQSLRGGNLFIAEAMFISRSEYRPERRERAGPPPYRPYAHSGFAWAGTHLFPHRLGRQGNEVCQPASGNVVDRPSEVPVGKCTREGQFVSGA